MSGVFSFDTSALAALFILCCARLCNSCVMAVLRSVLAIGDVLATSLRGVVYAVVDVSVVLLVMLLDPPPVADP